MPSLSADGYKRGSFNPEPAATAMEASAVADPQAVAPLRLKRLVDDTKYGSPLLRRDIRHDFLEFGQAP